MTSYAGAREDALEAIRAALPFSLTEAMGGCGEFRPLEWRVGGGAAYGKVMLAVEEIAKRYGHARLVAYFRGLRKLDSEVAFRTAFSVQMREYLLEFERRMATELRR